MSILAVLLLFPAASPADKPDWRAQLQEPFARKPVPDLGLVPVLKPADGPVVSDRKDWPKAREALARAWRARLGPDPPRPERLDLRVESREDLGDHVREFVTFAAEGDDRIRAYLLTPPGLKPGEKRAAVVVFHPTTNDTLREPVGLGQRPDMALARDLVRRGYVTLSPECYIMKGGGPRAQAEALARRRPGWTGLGKMTFDASRCVDLLEAMPQVDRTRIAAAGHSLGAKEVLFAVAFEPRYRAGVFSEGGIGLRMSNWTDPWYLTEAMTPHIPTLENHQVLALVAPRPFLILGGDSADGDASWAFVKAVLPVYELLGAGDRIGLHNHHGGHAFPANARALAYRWLDSVLNVGR